MSCTNLYDLYGIYIIMKEDKNRKYINYVVDHLVADTERTEFPGIIDPPFISGVETTSLYTDLAHVQEWKTRQYDSFVEYVKDIYGVIDKELALVWNLYGRRYMNLYDSEEMLREEVSAKDVHDAADEAGIPWDNDKKFMKLSKEVTGKEHIDDMTSQEIKKLIKKILKEDIGERSWTSEFDRMKWAIQDFESMVLDLYPFWWMNAVRYKKMFNSLADMSQESRDKIYNSIERIHFYWKAAKEDFNDANLYYGVDWGDGYGDPNSKQDQNRKKIMIYTKKANPYVGEVIRIINDPDAIKLVR